MNKEQEASESKQIGRFYDNWKRRQRDVLQDKAYREHEEHRQQRPLCHNSHGDPHGCMCTCGGMYHGGRMPIYGDSDDES